MAHQQLQRYLSVRTNLLQLISFTRRAIPIMMRQEEMLQLDPTATIEEKDEVLQLIGDLLDHLNELEDLLDNINGDIFMFFQIMI